MTEPTARSVEPQDPTPGSYEAPGIETVLTPEDLEREVIYAGPASIT
jgi:hypothetical protein